MQIYRKNNVNPRPGEEYPMAKLRKNIVGG
jgi:hypothetical protein